MINLKIPVSDLRESITAATVMSSIGDLQLKFESGNLMADSTGADNARMACITVPVEEIIEEGLWNIPDTGKAKDLLGNFNSDDILKIVRAGDKISVARTSPRKSYTFPMARDQDIAAKGKFKPIVEGMTLYMHRFQDGRKILSPHGDFTMKFKPDVASFKKPFAKKDVFSDEVLLSYNKDVGALMLYAKEDEYGGGDEIILQEFEATEDLIEASYTGLGEVVKSLTADTELEVYFGTDNIIYLKGMRGNMELEYVIMPKLTRRN